MDGQEAASIAVAVLFGILTLVNLVNFKLTVFRVYLLSVLSCALRTAGFSIRAVYFRDLANGTINPDLAPTWTVLALAGYGISLAVVCLMMGCWFKNAAAAQQYARFSLSVRVRLLIAPFIIFGPIMAITTAALVYGDGSPSALATAGRTSLAGGWGMFGALVILLAAVSFAAWAAVAARRSVVKPSAPADADALVLLTLLCTCMGMVVIVFKLVGAYHPQYNINANLYFPLQVLPQLIALCVISFPRLLARMSMGAGYEAWQAGEVAAPEEAAAEANGKHEQAV